MITEKDSKLLIKFIKKIKKYLMNFLGNIKQDSKFYLYIRESIGNIQIKIEEIIIFINKILLNLRPKNLENLEESDTNQIISVLNSLADFSIILFDTNSNNIFLNSAIGFFNKFVKSITKIKHKNTQILLSAFFHQKFVKIINIIINHKIEYVDKFKDSKLNFKLIELINNVIDLIILRTNSKKDFEFLSKNNSLPNISEVFNYILISKTNIFSLNCYIFFENFSEVFYNIIKKLIFISKKFYLNSCIEEIKKVLNITLHKLMEISKIKDDLKNNLDEGQHEFYLDSLNLQIKLTKLLIKNFQQNILSDDEIKQKICKFLIELSFWDSLDVVDNTCKFFVLLWKISMKFDTFMRSDLEKLISFIFLRRFKEYFDLIEKENEESSIRLSVIEILVNYLNILIREYNFVYLVYLNYDFSKIRNNILSDILRFCQNYYNLKGDNYSHLKTSITNLYLNIFDIIYSVFINENLNNDIEENVENLPKENKIEIDYDMIKEIQTFQDFWHDEVMPMINSENSNFKKFNNKIVPLFGLNPIPTIHKKKSKTENEDNKSNSSISENDELNNSSNSLNENDKDNSFDSSNSGKIEKKTNFNTKANYKKIAYTIAIMIKYSAFVDVNKLFEIFGNKNEFSGMIIKEYLNTFDFRNFDILKAYRIFVSTFKLTGESDTIYNIIVAFSEKYFKDNQKDENLRSVDEVSTLAYSVLMLNTDLHDPNIKEHMTIEAFSKNVYSTKMFDHISKNYLDNIYKSLSTNGLKVPSLRLEDFSKSDELYDILKSKRNFISNKSEFCANDNEVDESEMFVADYDIRNLNQFFVEMFNGNEIRKKEVEEFKESPLEMPKTKKIINFVLSNLCENFNTNDNSSNLVENNFNNQRITKSIYYLLWEDIFYNFMGISGIFYEIKDQNLSLLIDKICLISQALNKKDFIDKLIVSYFFKLLNKI